MYRLTALRSFGGGGGDFSSSTSDSARHFEVGLGEHTTSLAWLPNNSSCLVVGMGKTSTYLRLYDIRGQSQSHSTMVSFPFHLDPISLCYFVCILSHSHSILSLSCLIPTFHSKFCTYLYSTHTCIHTCVWFQFSKSVTPTLDRERPRDVANNKAIFGICVDPLAPHILATHAEVSKT